jgi:hypothetical protein
METPEILVSIGIGLGLAAACGFRIFVPLLAMSVASHTGHLSLGANFEWIASFPAMIAFGSATLLEIGAYYIPWVDNLLDTVATPSAVIAGALATASQVSELDPLLGWTVAIVGGGGAAGLVQGITSLTRGASTLATGGFANPLVSTVEVGASIMVSVLAILVPFAAVLILLGLAYIAASRLLRRRAEASPA